MKYALLIYEAPGAYADVTPEEGEAIYNEYMAIRGRPDVIDGGHLAPIEVATTVRVRDGESIITDGPFADTKEIFAGYFVLEADTVDTALEVAALAPATRKGGSVEVRPLLER
jgi:hypothetical protein